MPNYERKIIPSLTFHPFKYLYLKTVERKIVAVTFSEESGILKPLVFLILRF